MDKLDKQVVPVVELLNQLPGIKTFASCSGHGYDDCYIAFTCTNFESLAKVVKAVYSLRYEAGDTFDAKKHLWMVNFLPCQNRGDGLALSIDYQGEPSTKRRKIKMGEAWKGLELGLSKEVADGN